MGNKWYLGIAAIGMIFITLGSYAMCGVTMRHGFFAAGNMINTIFIVSGLGLISKKMWARVLTLIFISFMFFSGISRIFSAKKAFVPGFLVIILSFFAVSFVYLLLPEVKKEFRGKKRTLNLMDSEGALKIPRDPP